MSIKKTVLCLLTALYVGAVLYCISIWFIVPFLGFLMVMFGISFFITGACYSVLISLAAFVVCGPLAEAAINTYRFVTEGVFKRERSYK